MLGEDYWPDLTISCILQIYRHYVTTGDTFWLEKNCWEDLKKMHESLKQHSSHGIPEGGSTYDTFSYPGTVFFSFIYLLLFFLF